MKSADVGGQFLAHILNGLALALFFGPALYANLEGAAHVNANVLRRTIKLVGAMSVISFFLGIVFFVLAIPASVMMVQALGPYADQIESGRGDVAEVQKVVQDALAKNPTPFILLLGGFGLVWLFLTSRLYLCAPASIAEDRVATFETWRWTQGNLLRISATRLLLLGPIFIAVNVGAFAAAGLIEPIEDTGAKGAAALALAYFSALINLIAYSSCEAALSAYLYRGLKPPA